jgi:hypothetical protein
LQSGRVQPDGAFSPNARAPSGKIQKTENPPYDHPANPTGWSFFDRNFLLKRFRESVETFSQKIPQTLENTGMETVTTRGMENPEKIFIKKHRKTLDFFARVVYTLTITKPV